MEYQTFAAGVLVKVGEEILILRRAPDDEHQAGKWGLPGGGVDEGEHSRTSVRRELEEEAGIVVDDEKLELLDDAVYELAENDKIRYRTYLLELNKKPEITLSFEHDKYEWVKPKAFAANPDRVKGVRVLFEHLGWIPKTGTHRINAEKYVE